MKRRCCKFAILFLTGNVVASRCIVSRVTVLCLSSGLTSGLSSGLNSVFLIGSFLLSELKFVMAAGMYWRSASRDCLAAEGIRGRVRVAAG